MYHIDLGLVEALVAIVVVVFAAYGVLRLIGFNNDVTTESVLIVDPPKEKKLFTLGHVALYAKGWYQKSDDIWKDLAILFEADGYLQGLHKADIYRNIVSRLDEMNLREMEAFQLLDSISPEETWKFGYVTRGNYPYGYLDNNKAPEYNFQEAVARYCLSIIRYINIDRVEMAVPDFKNVLPPRLHDGETKKNAIERVKERFENVIV